MTRRPAPRRPPVVVVGWAGVLAITVGLGILGRAGEAVVVPLEATPAASRTGSTAAPPAPGRPRAAPTATRPPIGEDGVMGGLVFGTAWSWLEPATAGAD